MGITEGKWAEGSGGVVGETDEGRSSSLSFYLNSNPKITVGKRPSTISTDNLSRKEVKDRVISRKLSFPSSAVEPQKRRMSCIYTLPYRLIAPRNPSGRCFFFSFRVCKPLVNQRGDRKL
jgi:hypothetical protein